MKKFKATMALLLAMVMVLSLGITVFATEDTGSQGTNEPTTNSVPTSQTIAEDSAANEEGKYTISVAENDTHTYTVYQILTGTLIAGERKLGNPAWGSDAKGGEDNTVQNFITAISASGLSNVQINDLVKDQLKDGATGVGTVKKDSPLNVAPGYYLLIDSTAELSDGDAKSLHIVAVFNDIAVTPKKGSVVSEKHVDDQNDSDASDHSELKDSADYDIGDSIPYTLTMTLPADYANYKQYKIVFTDDMSAGLTYNGDAKIFYGAADTSYDVDFVGGGTSSYNAGTVYTYTIENLKAENATVEQKALKAGDVITIKYTATLNDKAVIGSAGNPNKYKVDYSSNPNQDAGGKIETNDTPWDVNIVFTYKAVFNKVDGNGKPLTGADFTLFKFIAGEGTDTYGDITGKWTNVQSLHTADGVKNPTKAKEEYQNDKGKADGAKFTFSGLDAGVYKLVETTTPGGYNTLEDQIFTITAEHELVSNDPKLTSLVGTDSEQFTMTTVKEGEDTNSVPTGELSAEIRNQQGSVLPETGGMGTRLFYILGACLVIGAGMFLVIRRRMSVE